MGIKMHICAATVQTVSCRLDMSDTHYSKVGSV